LLICLTGASIFYFLMPDKKTAEKQTEARQEAEKTIDNPIAEAELKTPIVENAQPINEIPNIPILMYHYIRTVVDQNDTLGINLSVEPTKFAEQLDEIQKNGYETINFYNIEQGNIPTKPIILTFDDGYKDFYTTAYPELRKRNMTAVVYVIANNDGANYITTDQIREIADNGIEIGSHTLSHIDLSTANTTKASNEISQSKTRLESIIGKNVISFCYPAGKYTLETIEIVKGAGYKYATTTKSGIADFDGPLELSRYRMNSDTNIKKYIK
jgi:peptidoglycan/xylan/chitin deacetylase (PgdA/CDA1 family)